MKKRIYLVISMLFLLSLAACQFVPETDSAVPPDAQTEVARIVKETLDAATLEAAGPAEIVPAVPTEEGFNQPTVAVHAPAVKPTKPPAQPVTVTAGLKVAFILNEDIYLWQPGLSSARLTEHGGAVDLRISPDGAWIVYKRKLDDLRQELWALKSDGSEDRLLVAASDLSASSPGQTLIPAQMAWAPGGHRLLFNTVAVMSGPGQPPSNDLRLVDVDASEKKIILPAGSGGNFMLSPDGKKVLLLRESSFAIANLDGSGLRPLFSFPQISTYSEWVYYPDPVWNQDSKSFRVIIPPADSLGRPDDPTVIWEIPVDGSPARQLASFVAAPAWRFRPLLSPNGRNAAYQTVKSKSSDLSDLHIMNIDLNNTWTLRTGSLQFKNWSPDSLRVGIYLGDRMEIQVGTITGNFTSMPVGIKPVDLSWVDSRRVLVLSGNRESPELYLLELGGPAVKIAAANNPNLEFDVAK